VDLEHGCWGDNSRSLDGRTVCKGTIFWGERCHRDVTVGGWGVTVGVVVTVVDIIMREIDITVGTMVITVVGAWWGRFAEQGGQTQHPCHPGKT